MTSIVLRLFTMDRKHKQKLIEEHFAPRIRAISYIAQLFRKGFLPLDENPLDKLHVHSDLYIISAMGQEVWHHWSRILDMEQYAREDLLDIAAQEGKILDITDFRTRPPAGLGPQIHGIEKTVDKLCHSYFGRLSTWIDNLYYWVAHNYDLVPENGRIDRKGVQESLKGVHGRMRQELKDTFGFADIQDDLNQIRNKLTHSSSNIIPFVDIDGKVLQQRYALVASVSLEKNRINDITKEQETVKVTRKVDLFNYLIRFYAHNANGTYHCLKFMKMNIEPGAFQKFCDAYLGQSKSQLKS
ncbi:MAG: hypothetical protein V1837_00525 [Candidatus Woesearchaeota archaeon]